jgi:RNA-directed DNA polymerase
LIKSVPAHKSLLYSPNNKGLPIGNLTSQFFANLYLNELDQYCKHILKIKYYYRYMDDMLILHSDKKQLLIRQNEISIFLHNKLKLKLHPNKIKLKRILNGIDFLGYIIKPSHILIRKRTVKKLKNKLWQFNREIGNIEDEISLFENPYGIFADEAAGKKFQHIFASVNSYYGLMRHTNCLSLRKHIYEKYFGILKIYLRPANKYYDYFIWTEP